MVGEEWSRGNIQPNKGNRGIIHCNIQSLSWQFINLPCITQCPETWTFRILLIVTVSKTPLFHKDRVCNFGLVAKKQIWYVYTWFHVPYVSCIHKAQQKQCLFGSVASGCVRNCKEIKIEIYISGENLSAMLLATENMQDWEHNPHFFLQCGDRNLL